MNISGKVHIILILLMTCILTICYYSADSIIGAFVITAFGLLWLFAQRLEWAWPGTIGFIIFSAVILKAAYLDIPPWWLFVCMVLGLSAWDIEQFRVRVRRAGDVQGLEQMEFDHLIRLAFVASTGLILGSITLFVKVNLSFGWMLFLSAVLVFVLSRLFVLLKKKLD